MEVALPLLAGQSSSESAALLVVALGWLLVGVMWLRLLRKRRNHKRKTSRWLPLFALLLGPLVGAAMWAGLIYWAQSDATDFERLEVLPLFMGMGFGVGVILAFALAAAGICDDGEQQIACAPPRDSKTELDPSDDPATP